MINPTTQLLMTKRAEMNIKLQELEKSWRKGEISFQVYNERTKMLIKNQYMAEQEEANELHKDREPTALLGIALRVIRKIFH